MAVIRPARGSPYRYYGSPREQRRPGKVQSTIMKVLGLIIIGLILVIVTALLGMFFFYAGWNWGVVPAIAGTSPVTIFGAFWLSLGISSIGGMFKSSLTVNSKDD